MDEEQIKLLLTQTLSEFKTELLSAVDTKNQGLAASLTRKLEKPKPEPETTTEDDTQKLTLKALNQRIADLTSQIENEKKASFKSAAESALVKSIADSGAQNTGALRKLLLSEYGEKLRTEGGEFFVENGDVVVPLSTAISTYLSTDEGKYFMPPSGVKGAGSSETRQVTSSSSEKQSTEQAIFDSFSEF